MAELGLERKNDNPTPDADELASTNWVYLVEEQSYSIEPTDGCAGAVWCQDHPVLEVHLSSKGAKDALARLGDGIESSTESTVRGLITYQVPLLP